MVNIENIDNIENIENMKLFKFLVTCLARAEGGRRRSLSVWRDRGRAAAAVNIEIKNIHIKNIHIENIEFF